VAEPGPPDGEYRRPELPFERRRDPRYAAAWRWSAAGIEFGVSVVVFFLGGNALDGKLGTGPWLALAGSLVGVAVGTYLLVRPLLRQPPGDGEDRGRGGPAAPS
jgi:hypothetical protein